MKPLIIRAKSVNPKNIKGDKNICCISVQDYSTNENKFLKVVENSQLHKFLEKQGIKFNFPK